MPVPAPHRRVLTVAVAVAALLAAAGLWAATGGDGTGSADLPDPTSSGPGAPTDPVTTPGTTAPTVPETTTTRPPPTTTTTTTTTTTRPLPPPLPPPPPPTTEPRPEAVNCAEVPCVALTFDDGPGPHTDHLLDVLAERQVRATFFVLGSRVAARPGPAARAAAEGHEIANHSWAHADFTKLEPAEIADDVRRTNEAIAAATGRPPVVVRPPYGRVDEKVVAAIGSEGMASVLWDVDTRDWDHHDTDLTVLYVAAEVRPGAIVLQHDIHPESVAAVPKIIDLLRTLGYELVTVSELLGPVQPGALYHHRR